MKQKSDEEKISKANTKSLNIYIQLLTVTNVPIATVFCHHYRNLTRLIPAVI